VLNHYTFGQPVIYVFDRDIIKDYNIVSSRPENQTIERFIKRLLSTGSFVSAQQVPINRIRAILVDEDSLDQAQQVISDAHPGVPIIPIKGLINHQSSTRQVAAKINQALSNDKNGKTDAAMSATAPGGGDFTADSFEVEQEGESVPVFDTFEVSNPTFNVEFDGLYPIIINITPLPSVPLYLGLTDTEEDSNITIEKDLKTREPEYVGA